MLAVAAPFGAAPVSNASQVEASHRRTHVPAVAALQMRRDQVAASGPQDNLWLTVKDKGIRCELASVADDPLLASNS